MPRCKVLVGAALLGVVAMMPGTARAQQAVSFNLGYFAVRGAADRVDGDTLVANLAAPSPFELSYNINDLNGTTVGGEWLFPIGTFLEGGVGISYYARTTPSTYQELVNSDGSDITQNLRLRIVPITASVRLFPLGRRAPIQPYIGAGVGVFLWRYSETGEFVDAQQNVFTATFAQSGTTVGPVILGGIRLPVARVAAFGAEMRYQKADAGLSSDFVGSRIDLGGITYQATFVLRF